MLGKLSVISITLHIIWAPFALWSCEKGETSVSFIPFLSQTDKPFILVQTGFWQPVVRSWDQYWAWVSLPSLPWDLPRWAWGPFQLILWMSVPAWVTLQECWAPAPPLPLPGCCQHSRQPISAWIPCPRATSSPLSCHLLARAPGLGSPLPCQRLLTDPITNPTVRDCGTAPLEWGHRLHHPLGGMDSLPSPHPDSLLLKRVWNPELLTDACPKPSQFQWQKNLIL